MCIDLNTLTPKTPSHRLVFRSGKGVGALDCWMALPHKIAPDVPPLIAVHGIRRGARLQAALFAERAAAVGQVVIAPIFDKTSWLGYQQTFLCGRADLALLDLMLALRREGTVTAEQLDLFGFSGGAQFAHRFAMLHPDRVSHLSTASPGWYTFPDNATYPYGLWPRPNHADAWSYRMIANLDRFLALPMRVSVGENDCLRDKNTRSGAAIDAQQGLTRLDRARKWTEAIRTVAAEMRIAPKITLHVLEGCGHDFETCVTKGGLDRIVIPDAPTHLQPAALCRGTCSARQQMACQARRAATPLQQMEATR